MFHLYSFGLLVIFISSSALAGAISGYTYARPTVASSGFNYDKPTVATNGYAYQKSPPYSLESTGSGGHYFSSLPTVKPIPAVPNLPPLPTPRSNGAVHQQAIFQTHPSSVYTSPTSGPATYIPPPTQHSSAGKIVQQYRPSSIPTDITSFGSFSPPVDSTATGLFAPSQNPTSGLGGSFLGTFSPTMASSPSGPNAPLESQPLRIPFGKSALIRYPDQAGSDQDLFGAGNAREIKQYAVVEIIDNDIVQKIEPFLPAQVRNENRAQFGATGTGASANSAIQFSTRANTNVLEQQRVSAPVNSDSIALGSGGLGFIRLSNGNVYLGSGSLGYISGQQLSQNVNEARTRSEQAQPDAVHFGHGSLGGGLTSFNRVFRFR